MLDKIKATYQKGLFVPQSPCVLPENAEVELIVQPATTYYPEVIDPERRKEILQTLLRRMRQTSIAAHSRRLNP